MREIGGKEELGGGGGSGALKCFLEDGEVVFSGVCGGVLKLLMDSSKDAQRAKTWRDADVRVSLCV